MIQIFIPQFCVSIDNPQEVIENEELSSTPVREYIKYFHKDVKQTYNGHVHQLVVLETMSQLDCTQHSQYEISFHDVHIEWSSKIIQRLATVFLNVLVAEWFSILQLVTSLPASPSTIHERKSCLTFAQFLCEKFVISSLDNLFRFTVLLSSLNMDTQIMVKVSVIQLETNRKNVR